MSAKSDSQASLQLEDANQTTGDGSALPTFKEAFEIALSEAIERQRKIDEQKAELAEQARLAALEAEELARKRNEIARKLELTESDAAAAELEVRKVRRSEPAAPVDAQAAKQIAKSIVAAFDACDQSRREEQDIRDFWEALDDAAAAALTQEVDETAIPLMLAVDAVLLAIGSWESQRREPTFVDDPEDSPLLDQWPGGSALIRRMLNELKQMLEGNYEPRKLEPLGDLFRQRLNIDQIAKAAGFVRIDGTADFAGLACVIDIALEMAGFYESVHGREHLTKFAMPSAALAWEQRQITVKARREKLLDKRGKSYRFEPSAMPEASSNPADVVPIVRRANANELQRQRIEENRRRQIDKANAEADSGYAHLK